MMAHPYNTRLQSLKRKATDNENENEHIQATSSTSLEGHATNAASSEQLHPRTKRRVTFHDPFPGHLVNGYATPSNTYLVPPAIDNRSPASPSMPRLERAWTYPSWLASTRDAVRQWFWTIAGPINTYSPSHEHGNVLGDNGRFVPDPVHGISRAKAKYSDSEVSEKSNLQILSDLGGFSDSELSIPDIPPGGQIYRTQGVPFFCGPQKTFPARSCDTTSCSSDAGELDSASSDSEMILVKHPNEKFPRHQNDETRDMQGEEQSQVPTNKISAEPQVTRKTARPRGKTFRENQLPKNVSFTREGLAKIFDDDGNENKQMYDVLFDTGSDTNFIARSVAIENGHIPEPLRKPDIRPFYSVDKEFTPTHFVVMRLHIYIKGKKEPLEFEEVSLRVVNIDEDKMHILLGHKFIAEQGIDTILMRSPEPAPGRALVLLGRKPTKEEQARMQAALKIREETARKLEARKRAHIQAGNVQDISTSAHQSMQMKNSQHRVNSGSSSLTSSSSSTNASSMGRSFSSTSSRTSFGESSTHSSNSSNKTVKG